MIRQIWISALLVLALGCARNEYVLDNVEQEKVTITASFADSKTRTVLSEDGGTSVYWEAGDEIAVFSGAEGSKFTSTLTEPAAVSTFTGTMPVAGGEKYLALYPYSSDAVSDGESITTTLPAEQTARAGSFAKNLNLSIAESDSNSMSFYNVCGGICFKLTKEGIKKITLKSNNGESLAGTFKLAFENGIPTVKEIIDGKDTITLTAPDNGTFATGVWYYIVTLPTTLTNGFQMTFQSDTKTYSQVATLTSSSSLTLKRHIFSRASDIDSGLSWKNEGNIIFADDVVKQACVAKFDTDNDGEISFDEASAVTDIAGLFDNYKTITSFDELQYFDHITELPSGLFGKCKLLKSVSIPSSVTSLGESCFWDCESLTSIAIPLSVTSLGEGCFESCTALESIEIPSSVTEIGSGCFVMCSSLESIEIPSSLTSLGEWCFSECSSLTSVKILSSPTSLGEDFFYNCTSLTSIEIPSSVTSLGFECFYGCASLVSIVIPSSVTEVGENCFRDCTNLSEMHCLATSVPSVGYYSFYNTKANTEGYLYVPEESVELYKESRWKVWKNIQKLE